MIDFSHYPVMLNECIDGLNIKEDGIYIDCTLGGGNHSEAILKNLTGNGKLIVFDKDNDAITFCKEKLSKYSKKLIMIHDDFKNVIEHLDSLNIDKIDGYLMDLGVSSYQIDTADRGFSYINDAELDMRMDRSQKLTAKDIVNEYSAEDLAKIIYLYGEEKYSRSIAKNILKERSNKSINTTLELAEIIKKSVPPAYRYKGGNPCKKTFQALRIEVNSELDRLKDTIISLTRRLNVGGRAVIISFHSLEDRIVKQSYIELEKDCICPAEQYICTCNKKREIKIITKKPIVATDKELEENSRSKSAKLRIAEKIKEDSKC